MEEKERSVVIVDDDSFLLDMYVAKFKERMFAVHGFASGEDALAALEDGLRADVILFDVVMPGLAGEEFLEKVQQKGVGGKAVLIGLSNQHDETLIASMRKKGMASYILKAGSIPSQVVATVERLLDERTKNT